MTSPTTDGIGTRRTLWWLVICISLLFSSTATASDSTAAIPAHRLHEAMVEQIKAQALQGAVWALVEADGSIIVDAAGIKDARHGHVLRVGDKVHVGSVAKTLLATGVLRLVTQQRLALDTPVSELLPAVRFDNPWEGSDPVRVRHLLDHTAGLDDARLSQVFSLKPSADTPLVEVFAGRGPLLVRSRPGSRHSYSNTGYTLLGMIIEAVTRSRYETYLDAHLLRPLGMHDSTFGFTTQEGRHPDARLAMGHFEDGATQAAVPTYLRPAGQFTTTATDMGRLAHFLMGAGRVDGKPFIDTALLQAMGRPAGTEAAGAGLRVGYGLGLATRDRHGAVGKCHGGSTIGYRAMLCLFPQQHRAFFVAINADIEGADYGRFDRLLIRALRVESPAPKPPKPASTDTSAWAGYYIPAPNRFAGFAWLDTTLNFVRVRSSGGALQFKPFQSEEVLLTPAGGSLFRASDRAIASHAVLVARDGKRLISTGLQSFEEVSLPKLIALWASLVAGLLGVAWLLLAGATGLVARRGTLSQPILIPFAGIVALLIPLPFFYRQSFLQLGDLTLASVSLAAVTLLLPLTMLVGLGLSMRRRPWRAKAAIDVVAMLAVLVWCAVLAWWGLLPLRLWE